MRAPLEQPDNMKKGSDVKPLHAQFKQAKTLRSNWEAIWQDIYDHCLPHRESFFEMVSGEQRTDLIYDETAVVGTPRFASRALSGVFPPNSYAFRLTPGPDLPAEYRNGGVELQQQLDAITDRIHEAVWNSNFQSEAHEAFIDLGVGTGNLTCEGGDFKGDLVFAAMPLTQTYMLPGPNDYPRAWFRCRKIAIDEIKIYWPRAKLSVRLSAQLAQSPDKPPKVEVIEAVVRDLKDRSTESYTWSLFTPEDETVMEERKVSGDGSLPWTTFRWSKSAIEVWGRGPLMQALPAIKTLNAAIEMILMNAQIAMGGVWAYDDDGVFNVDNVTLEPGTFIPRMPGTTIDEIVPSGRFDLSQLVIEDMRSNVRKSLFVDQLERDAKTPLSATEVAERMAELARDMSAVSGRLKNEFLFKIVRRIVYVLKKQGVIDIPKVNGREIRIIPESPLLRAQNQQSISDWLRYQESLQMSFGPQGAQMVGGSKIIESAHYLAELHGIPARLVPTAEEMQQQMEQAAAIAQQAGMLDQGGQ